MNITDLIERLEKAEGSDREIDCYLWVMAKGGDARMHYISDKNEFVWERGIDGMWIRAVERFKTVQRFTLSLDAAIELAEKALPGWGWRVATCAVSDDAWVFPDFNSPVHGERLKREFREDIDWADLTDVDLRPAGRPAIALCIAILKAKQQSGETNGG